MNIHHFRFEIFVEDVAGEGSDVLHDRLYDRLLCTTEECTCHIGMLHSEVVETIDEDGNVCSP